MQIQLKTDNHIDGSAKLARYVESLVSESLERFGKRITSVHVHLTDENSGHKSGGIDKRCVMEARISGRQPVIVTADAPTVNQSLAGAVTKLEKSLAHTFDRSDNTRSRASYAGEVLYDAASNES